eukprot:EC849904.1.p2 GENE.EC849904.1~~EC849904.1.p2  ORF type:complete len:78 (-),score=2.62 EC849904.1:236-469(-)
MLTAAGGIVYPFHGLLLRSKYESGFTAHAVGNENLGLSSRSAIQESKVASRFSGRVLAIHQCRHLKNQRAGGMRVAD